MQMSEQWCVLSEAKVSRSDTSGTDVTPCPLSSSGEHLLDVEEGSSGVTYTYCVRCGEIWDE